MSNIALLPPFAAEVHSSLAQRIALPTGDLSVHVNAADLPLEDLCGFAARRNPKRGFIFVSRVLGKHHPVKPTVMAKVHHLLARKIAVDLPGPIVIIGMAETAICLGQGVHEEYVSLARREDIVFSHSTRYQVDKPVLLEFAEEHSHAMQHIIYMPEDPHSVALVEAARTIILVDDEVSTGKTLVNLITAFQKRIPSLQYAITASITDWRGADCTAENHAAMPIATDTVSILSGRYHFAPHPDLKALKLPHSACASLPSTPLLSHNYGRFGVRGRLDVQIAHFHPKLRHCLAESAGKILVLGTGEFAFPPFLLAKQLEELGVEVFFQTTTRSPIMTGHAIATALSFLDNYSDGIPNFLYNVAAGQYDKVLIAHETPNGSVDAGLITALEAETLEM